MPLQDVSKHLLITGAGSGIGLAAVEAALQSGHKVTALDLDGAALARMDERGLDALSCRIVDVTDEAQVEAAIAAAEDEFGPIDGCLNNAGIPAPLKPVADLSVSDFEKVFSVNTFGSFLVLKHIIRAMTKSGGGAIVNTGSILGNRGVPNYAVYCASKAAVHAITKAAALEVADANIRVNAVAPGLVDTPMNDDFHAKVSPGDPASTRKGIESKIPLGRYATAEEVADIALFLLEERARYITGEILDVDGGLSTSF